MYERIFYLLLAETRDVFYVQTMFEEENAEHLHISLILHFSTSPILQLPLSSKIVQSTCTPILLPDRYFISSDSLQKPGMVTPQFSQASKTVHPPEGGGAGILKFCAPLLYPRIMTQANLS